MRRIALLAGLLCLSLLASAEERPLKVVCFGDSITGDRPGKPYVHQYLKYADLLQLVLETHLGTGKAVVLNRGWGGDTVLGKPTGNPPGALNRLKKDVLDEKPDIATILIGGNDAGKADALPEAKERVRKALTDMVQQLKAANVKVLLLQYHEPKATDMAKVWTHLNKMNDVIGDVAKEQHVPVLDMAPAFAAAAQNGAPQEALTNTTDGVHLNPYGEVVFARTIFQKLKELDWVKLP